jgi:hypothetical protein
MRAVSLSPERRREIATTASASAAAVKARKRIPKGKRSEIAKKAAAVRWGKKRDRGDVALDAVPPSDSQSSAHRFEGDMQDAAAGRPTSPGEAGGAVPDGNAVVRDLYTESQLLRQQLVHQQLAQSASQTYRPLGPGDCTLHSSVQRCQKCGAAVKPVHMMIRMIHGFFCESCCPACHPKG